MNKNDLQDKIKNLQDTYYQNNKKNTFFKNKQKYDCAETITQQVNINTLLQNTIFLFIIPITFSSIILHLRHLLIQIILKLSSIILLICALKN